MDTGWPYGVASSSLYALFNETLDALIKVFAPIEFPVSDIDCSNSARKFQLQRNSPLEGTMAVLDGIAMKIHQLTLNVTPGPLKYFNRKGFYALCVQAAVSAKYKFVFVSARHAGGTDDSTAFQATLLYSVVKMVICLHGPELLQMMRMPTVGMS